MASVDIQKLQIVIPLTGNGSRFVDAGYERLKPFIEIHGTPIIEWVVKLFPGYSDNIIFVCRRDHWNSLDYFEPTLRRIAPKAKFYFVKDWKKRGPVADILSAKEVIHKEHPVLVSYCDYFMHWNFPAFLKGVVSRVCDGAVPCYTGFHPHLLPKDNLYASCKTDANENLIEIREKYSWTSDKHKALHSPGVYYLRSGAILQHYYKRLIDTETTINGEFYASMPYNLMVDDGLTIWCPSNVSSFCQWGTPRDLEDYIYWTNTVSNWSDEIGKGFQP